VDNLVQSLLPQSYDSTTTPWSKNDTLFIIAITVFFGPQCTYYIYYRREEEEEKRIEEADIVTISENIFAYICLLRNGIDLDETWQIDGSSGTSDPIEFSKESLQWFRLAALKTRSFGRSVPVHRFSPNSA